MKHACKILIALVCMVLAGTECAKAQGVKIYKHYDRTPIVYYAHELDSIQLVNFDQEPEPENPYTFNLDTSDPNRLVLTCYENGVVYAIYDARFVDGMCVSYVLTSIYKDGEVDVYDMSDIYEGFSYNSLLSYFKSYAGMDYYSVAKKRKSKIALRPEKPMQSGKTVTKKQ